MVRKTRRAFEGGHHVLVLPEEGQCGLTDSAIEKRFLARLRDLGWVGNGHSVTVVRRTKVGRGKIAGYSKTR